MIFVNISPTLKETWNSLKNIVQVDEVSFSILYLALKMVGSKTALKDEIERGFFSSIFWMCEKWLLFEIHWIASKTFLGNAKQTTIFRSCQLIAMFLRSPVKSPSTSRATSSLPKFLIRLVLSNNYNYRYHNNHILSCVIFSSHLTCFFYLCLEIKMWYWWISSNSAKHYVPQVCLAQSWFVKMNIFHF